jgi:hypothetical protein
MKDLLCSAVYGLHLAEVSVHRLPLRLLREVRDWPVLPLQSRGQLLQLRKDLCSRFLLSVSYLQTRALVMPFTAIGILILKQL